MCTWQINYLFVTHIWKLPKLLLFEKNIWGEGVSKILIFSKCVIYFTTRELKSGKFRNSIEKYSNFNFPNPPCSMSHPHHNPEHPNVKSLFKLFNFLILITIRKIKILGTPEACLRSTKWFAGLNVGKEKFHETYRSIRRNSICLELVERKFFYTISSIFSSE